MGNLLKLLSREDCPKYDVFVDFENAQPTELEKETYAVVQKVLLKSKDILYQLQTYKGAGNEIREAIANRDNVNLQLKAWETVVPLVDRLVVCYKFSLKLENIVPQLLMVLCSGNLTPKEHLETQQATVKQLAEILDFVLKFDDLKMSNPAIQNDFSYYRRVLIRGRPDDLNLNCNVSDDQLMISIDLANKMSLFYAQATPMLKVLSDSTCKFVNDNANLPIEYTTETLSTMSQVCQRMIENRFQNEETTYFVLRVMVGLIILYDHVHPNGAFIKGSHIDVKRSIKVLKEQTPSIVDGLLNALRYTTKHLNDENTPKHVKTLLA